MLFGLTINNFAQSEIITQKDYYAAFRQSQSELNNVDSWRTHEIKEYFHNGKSNLTTEEVNEFIKPDKRHYLMIEKSSGKTRRIESIKIGYVNYCRKNDETWRQSKEPCNFGGGISGFSNEVESTFTVESTTLNGHATKLYHQRVSFKNTWSANKGKEGLSYYDSKFWLDNKGLMMRHETEFGLSDPARINSKSLQLYEYNSKNLRIEAPINHSTKNVVTIVENSQISEEDALPVIVTLKKDSTLLLNGKATPPDVLRSEIEKRLAAKIEEDKFVYLRVDPAVEYAATVEMLNFGRNLKVDVYFLAVIDDANLSDFSKALAIKIPLNREVPINVKPNPLTLVVAVNKNGKITLNMEAQATPEILIAKLRNLFKERRRNRVFVEGSRTEIEKTVFLKASLSAKFGDVIILLEALKKSGAFPIGIQIDGLEK